MPQLLNRDQLKAWAAQHWPEIIAALAPILFFWRLVFGGQVLYWALPALQFVPWRVLVNEALREGRLPLWTPSLGMGAPLMANYQSAVFYPPNWLALLLPPEIAISALAVLHLSLAGVGMVRLARRLNLGNFGVAVVGLTFCLSGYSTGRLWFITINNAVAWLPWIVLAASPPPPSPPPLLLVFLQQERGRDGEAGVGARAARLSALIALQLLAGHAQTSFYTLLLATTWLIFHSFSNWRTLLRNSLNFILAVALAVGLAAIQLLPTYELLRQSPRAAAAEYEFVATYSLWPWRLLTFVAPNLFGHPADHNYLGYATYWEDHAYLSLLPLLFASYALATLIRKRHANRATTLQQNSALPVRSVVIFSLTTIVISVTLALGKNTPVFPFFYHFIPGFDLFQAPARMLVWYTFAVSLLAGIGADRWQASARKRYWARLGLAASGATLILSLLAVLMMTGKTAVVIAGGFAGAAVVALGTFLLILAQPAEPKRWQWLVLAFIALDLGLAAVRLNPAIDPFLYHLKPAFSLAQGRLYQFSDDEYRVKFSEFFRFKSFDDIAPDRLRASFLPNLPALDGIASANNFDPLQPERYVNYLEAMELSPRLLDLADVRALVKPMGAVSLREANTARLRLVYDSLTVPNGLAALSAITDPAFDPDAQVVIEPATDERAGLPLDPNRFVATVVLERDGFFVLSDTYYPGWRVFVDGEPQPLLRANYLFRAVAVPAGQHEVVFEYAPLSVTLGLIVSAISILVWVSLWWIGQRKGEAVGQILR
ncbi:MAG: YfhO family protein [Chloroflexi bacterium]|nr:YfhO family protein [Chloroflexota bacterium]